MQSLVIILCKLSHLHFTFDVLLKLKLLDSVASTCSTLVESRQKPEKQCEKWTHHLQYISFFMQNDDNNQKFLFWYSIFIDHSYRALIYWFMFEEDKEQVI